MNYSVRIRRERQQATITLDGEDTVRDVILAGCNALGIPYKAEWGLQSKAEDWRWRFVNTRKLVKDLTWTHEGFNIWPSKFPEYLTLHSVTVYEGSWDAPGRDIQVLPTYSVEKALRIGGVNHNGQSIFTDDKRAVTMSSRIGDFDALLLKPNTRVIAPSAQDDLTYFSVVYDGKEEHLAVSSRYSVVDIPFMLGVDEPVDKVCVCRNQPIVDDLVSVALYAGEQIEIQSISNYC